MQISNRFVVSTRLQLTAGVARREVVTTVRAADRCKRCRVARTVSVACQRRRQESRNDKFVIQVFHTKTTPVSAVRDGLSR